MKTLTWSLGVVLTIAVIPACGSRFFEILLQKLDPDDPQHPSNLEPDPQNPGRSTDHEESQNTRNQIKTDQNDDDDGNQNDENQLVKKLKDYAKRLFGVKDPAPVRVNLFGINFLPSQARKNLLGHDRTPVIILVPHDSKQPKKNLIPPGYTQFSPSQDMLKFSEDSNQLNQNNLRGNPENSEERDVKLNTSIIDFIHINSAKIKLNAAIGLLNILKTRKNLLGNDRNTAIILVPEDYIQPNSQDVPQNSEDSYQLQNENNLRTCKSCNKPENTKQMNKKTINTMTKDFFHMDSFDLNATGAIGLVNILVNKNSLRASEKPENSKKTNKETISTMIKDFFHVDFLDLNMSEAIGAINILATRKNQPGHNRIPVIILVPQVHKQPNTNLITPGYTQFKPSQDVLEDSNQINENILRGMPENSKETNAHEVKLNTSIKDNAKIRIINAIGLINILKINPEILKLKGLKHIFRAKRSDEETEENDTSPKFKRRSIMHPGEVILGVPTRPEHLPKALPMHPGHTLLRPARGMLKSSIKFPLRDFGGSAVYGNLDNLGITFGKTRSRVRYTDFRKTNDNLLKKIQDAIQSSKISGNGRSHPLVVIEIDPSEIDAIKNGNQNIKNNNEVLDDLDGLFVKDTSDPMDLRRKSKNKSKYRKRSKNYGKSKTSDEDKSESSSNSDSSIEKNEGNPFTIHKNKYKQNWLWNHKLDGVHVNVNPYAPQLNQLGPTGAELFFARKWWYFNQDDYKPMGRKR